MTSPADVARAMAQRTGSPVTLLSATGVSVAGTVATVELSDGTHAEVYPDASGRLPLPNAKVWAARVGGDIVLFGGEMQATGHQQSANWEGPDSTDGWGFTADGILYANAGVFRGRVIGGSFETAETGARVVIDSDVARQEVRFHTGLTGEMSPGAALAQSDADQATVEIRSPEFEEDHVAFFRVGVDLATGDTFGDLDADDLRAKGVSISRPPYSSKRRVAVQPVTAHASNNTVLSWDTDRLVNPHGGIVYNTGDSSFDLLSKGIYQGILRWGFGDAVTAVGDGTRRLIIEEEGAITELWNGNATGGRQTIKQVPFDVIVPDDTGYTVRFLAGQLNFGLSTLSGSGRVSIWKFSG